MKKTIFLIFFMCLTISYSQKKSINLSLSSGISTPSSNFSNTSYASSGSFIELSGAYYFSKLGAGVSIGSFSNPTEGNFLDYYNTQFSDPSLSPTISAQDWKTTYYGVGPEFKTSFGNAFEASFSTRIGSMSVKPIEIGSEISIDNADVTTAFPIVKFGTTETSKLSYYSAGIKLGYKISNQFGLYFMANYLSTLSKEISVAQSDIKILDSNRDGVITRDDLIRKDGSAIQQFETILTSKIVKPEGTNFGIGLTYSFGKRIIKIDGTEKPSDILRAEKKRRRIATKVDHMVNSGTVLFTNPSSKENKDKQQRKIVLTTPKNNSHFKSADEIENFDWELIGDRIPDPQYVIEITKIGSNKQPQRTYVGTTTDSKIAAKKVAKFKAGKALADTVKRMDNSSGTKEEQAGDGQYMWKVTETTTGIVSNPSYFTMSNCEIDFTISNDTIECLGYEGENRKFKICFDATYSSSSGDLTFANPGSGLSVYDQTYAALSFNLVSPNPTLVTQIGVTTSTISYCFEVTVGSGVTSIGFGLQGDDLDPSPIECQPGVSQLFDELPDCLCDDCEEIEVSFDDFTISPNGASGNQFNFNGNINVNVPIYGIEFQIQSYSYSAAPSACSEGVSSIEESGMILMPATTINGSTSLQLFNETVSGSPSSNNNATKDIKYTSDSPLTGSIPVNLTIGLPGPLSGLDPSCCIIDYRVCIKVKVFYEESNCKSCVFTHCFEFNNQ